MTEYAKYENNANYLSGFFSKYKLKPVKSISGFKYMFKGCTCQINLWLKQRLDQDAKALANGWDLVGAIAGMEGSGKTKGMGLTVCTYYAWLFKKDFTLDNIIFTGKQFENIVKSAKQGEIILWDEFVLGGSSEDTITDMQKALRKMFTLIRSKRLIIILILPYFHMMNKYWAVSRTRFLINCTSKDGISRGTAKFYGYKYKRYAYIHGKKNMSIDEFKYDQGITFLDLGNTEVTQNPIIDFDAYETKKQQALADIKTEKDQKKNNTMILKYRKALFGLTKYLHDTCSLKFSDISKLSGKNINKETLAGWLRDARETETETNFET